MEIKWRCELEIVDIDTGELVTKSEVERKKYYIVKKETKTEIKDGKYNKTGIKKIQWQVRGYYENSLFE